MLDEKNVLSDEELETVAGGITRYYEMQTHPTRGAYYRVTWEGGKTNIPEGKWEDYLKKCAARGDVLLPMTK